MVRFQFLSAHLKHPLFLFPETFFTWVLGYHAPCFLLHPHSGMDVSVSEFKWHGGGLSKAGVNPSLAKCSLPVGEPLH